MPIRGWANDCLLPAASLLRRTSPQMRICRNLPLPLPAFPYRKYPTSCFRVLHLIGPGWAWIEDWLDSFRECAQIVCPEARLLLINRYICISPAIINIWVSSLSTPCFALFVRGNKCIVGQQKQPADGFTEWRWHIDNAQQLQAHKIILKIASHYASEPQNTFKCPYFLCDI